MSDHKSASGHTSEQTPEHISEHISTTGSSVAIWLALLAGTGITVAAAFINLGPFNTIVALAIATIKATLVVLFFMHLSESHGVNRLVFVVSILFMLVLILGVFGDLLTRPPMSLPIGIPTTEGPEINVPLPHLR
jgi:cytochrome c oxidase subunit 4